MNDSLKDSFWPVSADFVHDYPTFAGPDGPSDIADLDVLQSEEAVYEAVRAYGEVAHARTRAFFEELYMHMITVAGVEWWGDPPWLVQWMKQWEPCPRSLAIYKPGEPMLGVAHSFRYTGSVPNTGDRVCSLCGLRVFK